MKKNSIFLGFTIPDDVAQNVFKIDDNPAIQTHKFAWSFVRSLSYFTKPFLLSSIPVSNYPSNKKIFFKGGSFTTSDYNGFYIPFINILVLKHLTRFIFSILLLLFFLHKKKSSIIYVHGVHSPYLLLCYFLSFFGIKYCILLTDPAGVVLPTDSLLSKFFKKIDKLIVSFFVRKADFIAGLSPKLIDYYNIKAPHIVFPGILNSEFSSLINFYSSHKTSITCNKRLKIVYAGGLHESYGIKLLVDAIEGLDKNIPIDLMLYGKGDQLEYIREKSIIDGRIKYMGFCGNSELVPALLNADLLINPRPSSQDFAVLSFPSKLIEYLATGIPVLTTRIQSIPLEYRELFFYIEDESVEGIQQALLEVFDIPYDIRKKKSLLARDFICDNASEKSIGSKISSMIHKFS